MGLTAQKKAKLLFQKIEGEWHSRSVANISPYLIEGSNIAISARAHPLMKDSLVLMRGNMPSDGGYLFLNRDERDLLIDREPQSSRWIKKVLGAAEFLNSKERWCLWLVDASDEDLFSMPEVQKRISAVRQVRLKGGSQARSMADSPHKFVYITQPARGSYILVPRVTSERRTYVPMGFFDAETISTDLNNILPDGTLYEFGILSSISHNDWMRLVAGRLKSDYRYSATVVYNTFPWPEVTETQRKEIENFAEEILLTREEFPGRTLAELYDPDKMPTALLAAHQALDRAVDRLYRDRPFKDAADRLSCLLARYEALVGN
ncbi:type IIL restriction-modification enzyme MmeI [Aeromonas veronii]